MKKIYLLALAACVTISFTSCEDKLDSVSYTKSNTENFPASTADVLNEEAAVYATMNNINNSPLQTPWFFNNILGDDCYGGGGQGDNEAKAIEHFTLYSTTMYDNIWKVLYAGIYRTNTGIATIDNVAWNGDTSSRNQALGEFYYMRAMFYLWLTQSFGDIPLVTSNIVPDQCPDASAETAIYPQILSDLVSAKTLMTGTKSEGHASKYAAEALLARAYMFYEGFYKNAGEMATANPEAVKLITQEGVTDGQTLSKADVVDALKDIKTNGKYSLVGDFRDLWQYTNKLTVNDYNYTSDQVIKTNENGTKDTTRVTKKGVDGNSLAWAGNGNSEEIFEVQYMNASSWNNTYPMAYSNQASLYGGLRCGADAGGKSNGYEDTFPFGQGWGQAPASANIWDDWTAQETADGKADIRKTASIIDCQSELTHYAFVTDCTEDPGYANKKYMAVTCKKTYEGKAVDFSKQGTFWTYMEGFEKSSNGNDMQGSHFEDTYLIRYADVLLMLTELTGDATYMNEVRARAGLDRKDYSWTNIQNERRWEFAFEGLRYNDLRRWSGINATKTSLICKELDAQGGKKINVCGSWTTMKHMTSSWSQRYLETKGFLPKPKTQIDLANGAMTQNAGWDTADATYKTLY